MFLNLKVGERLRLTSPGLRGLIVLGLIARRQAARIDGRINTHLRDLAAHGEAPRKFRGPE